MQNDIVKKKHKSSDVKPYERFQKFNSNKFGGNRDGDDNWGKFGKTEMSVAEWLKVKFAPIKMMSTIDDDVDVEEDAAETASSAANIDGAAEKKEGMKEKSSKSKFSAGERVTMVHRLDRHTSGVLLCAKNVRACIF